MGRNAPQQGGVYLGPNNLEAGLELGREAGKSAGNRDTLHVLIVGYPELANTHERARACLKIASLVQADMKRLMREGFDAPIERAKSFEQEVLFRLYSTRDGQEGIDAFLEKRPAEFEGR